MQKKKKRKRKRKHNRHDDEEEVNTTNMTTKETEPRTKAGDDTLEKKNFLLTSFCAKKLS